MIVGRYGSARISADEAWHLYKIQHPELKLVNPTRKEYVQLEKAERLIATGKWKKDDIGNIRWLDDEKEHCILEYVPAEGEAERYWIMEFDFIYRWICEHYGGDLAETFYRTDYVSCLEKNVRMDQSLTVVNHYTMHPPKMCGPRGQCNMLCRYFYPDAPCPQKEED